MKKHFILLAVGCAFSNLIGFLAALQPNEEAGDKGLPQLSFTAIHYTAIREFHVTAAYGTFTLAGPKTDSLKPLPKGILQVAYDPDSKRYYGLSWHEVYQVDLESKSATKMSLPKDLPELSWPSGITFDTKRRRVILVSFGGSGDMYAYSPKTDKWSHVTDMNNLDLTALVYDPKQDCLYGLQRQRTEEGAEIIRFNAEGAVVKKIKLVGDELPNELGRAGGPPVTLATAEGYVVIIAEGAVYLVEPASGKVRLTNKKE